VKVQDGDLGASDVINIETLNVDIMWNVFIPDFSFYLAYPSQTRLLLRAVILNLVWNVEISVVSTFSQIFKVSDY